MRLEVGMPAMLMRNLAPSRGLGNGSRLLAKANQPRRVGGRNMCGAPFGSHVSHPLEAASPEIHRSPFHAAYTPVSLKTVFRYGDQKVARSNVRFRGILFPSFASRSRAAVRRVAPGTTQRQLAQFATVHPRPAPYVQCSLSRSARKSSRVARNTWRSRYAAGVSASSGLRPPL